MTSLLILKNGRNHAVQHIRDALQHAGLRVMISFDSRHVRMEEAASLCPHHGSAVRNCHLVIMLVYGIEGHPVTLTVYKQDDEIWISLTYPPGLRPSSTLQSQIQAVLKPDILQMDISS